MVAILFGIGFISKHLYPLILDDSVVRTNHNEAVKTAAVTMLLSLVLSGLLVNTLPVDAPNHPTTRITQVNPNVANGGTITAATTTTSTSVTFHFIGTDNMRIVEFRCKWNGGMPGGDTLFNRNNCGNLMVMPPRSVSGGVAVDGTATRIRAPGPQLFEVKAFDGNYESISTGTAQWRFTISPPPPGRPTIEFTEALTYPFQPRILDTQSTSFQRMSIHYEITDPDNPIRFFQCSFDGRVVPSSPTSTQPLSCDIGIGTVGMSQTLSGWFSSGSSQIIPLGEHNVCIRAADVINPTPQQWVQNCFTWTIVKGPDLRFTSILDVYGNNILATRQTTSNSIRLSFIGTAGEITRFYCVIPGQQGSECAQGPLGVERTAGPFTIHASIPSGLYPVCVEAIDRYENSKPRCFEFTFNRLPSQIPELPDTRIESVRVTVSGNPNVELPLSPDGQTTTSRDISFRYRGHSSDGTIEGFWCSLQSSSFPTSPTFNPCNAGLGTIYLSQADAIRRDLSPGPYTFCVKAVNRAGEDPTPACWRWNIR